MYKKAWDCIKSLIPNGEKVSKSSDFETQASQSRNNFKDALDSDSSDFNVELAKKEKLDVFTDLMLHALFENSLIDQDKLRDRNREVFQALIKNTIILDEIDSVSIKNNIERFGSLLGKDQIKNIKSQYHILFPEVARISNKIKESLDGNDIPYIATPEGIRGDDFLIDLFYLFQGIEDTYIAYQEDQVLEKSKIKLYQDLVRNTQVYIATKMGIDTDKEATIGDIKADLKALGFYDNSRDDDSMLMDYLDANIQESSFTKSSLEKLHYGDIAEGFIEVVMAEKLYLSLEKGDIEDAKKKLKTLLYCLYGHQGTIAEQATSYIGKNHPHHHSDTVAYKIDSENIDDPILATQRSIYLFIRLLKNLSVAGKVNMLLKEE